MITYLDSEYEDLLHAALDDRERAGIAWKRWREKNPSFVGMNFDTLRLIPLVCRNLEKQGIHERDIRKMQDIYFDRWVANRSLVESVQPILDKLERVKIPIILFKGVALSAIYYKDFSVRSFGDIDVLVPERELQRAIQILVVEGLHPKGGLSSFNARFRHSLDFVEKPSEKKQRQIDLHCHAIEVVCRIGADDNFWKRAQVIKGFGKNTFTLSSEDHFLHACIHGVGFGWDGTPSSRCRWVADAITILRSVSLDWRIIVEEAERLEVSLKLLSALLYLREEFSVVIPEDVTLRLANIKPSKNENIYFALTSHNFSAHLSGRIRIVVWREGTKGFTLSEKIAIFPAFLKHIFNRHMGFFGLSLKKNYPRLYSALKKREV